MKNTRLPGTASLMVYPLAAIWALVITGVAVVQGRYLGRSALEDSGRPNHSEIKGLKTGADLSPVRPTLSVRPRKTRPVWTSR